jgi:UDP-N-acetylglucosamine acyltransferase
VTGNAVSPASPNIHPSALISPDADLADGVHVGPFCRIGRGVRIDTGCHFDSHVVVEGPTEIGARNRFYPFSTIGLEPQDLKFEGEDTFLTIGSDNIFREYVNIHRGTAGGGGETRIGNRNFLMVYAHIAHDCVVGNDIIMANAATLAGHVTIEDHATIGAFSGVHQFCRVGFHGYVGGYSVVTKDVLPFSKTVSARDTRAFGVNTIGLERKGFSSDQIAAIKKTFRLLLQSKLNTSQALDAIRREVDAPEAQIVVDFIEKSDRGIYK